MSLLRNATLDERAHRIREEFRVKKVSWEGEKEEREVRVEGRQGGREEENPGQDAMHLSPTLYMSSGRRL